MIQNAVCKQCGQSIEFDADLTGTSIDCQGCGGSVKLEFKSTGYAKNREQEKASIQSWVGFSILAVSFLFAASIAWYFFTHEDAADGGIYLAEAIAATAAEMLGALGE